MPPRSHADPERPPPALPAETGGLDLPEGRARYYRRPGAGRPLVLVHSFNAAASSFEMKPLFEHFAAQTNRPVYALDWFGFGLSDRPDVPYGPALFQRQLRCFLRQVSGEPADLVALSLGAEYAAVTAVENPALVHRLALIAPTGLSRRPEASRLRRLLVRLAAATGAFAWLFRRLSRRETLRRFYRRQVFTEGAAVPDALVDYAYATTHVRGAHRAPRRFVEGSLFLHETARQAYARLRVPTRFFIPRGAAATVQRFERLPEVLAQNAEYLSAAEVAGGLLPHWEQPEPLFRTLDAFLQGTVASA